MTAPIRGQANDNVIITGGHEKSAPEVVPSRLPPAPEAAPPPNTHGIREAVDADAAEVDRLLRLLCEGEGELYTPLPNLPRKIFVAQSDGEIVGMCAIFVLSDVQLSHLFVEERHRRQGFGRRLL